VTSGRWRLWRQDDHGNEFPVAVFSSRDEADAECVRFSALPHHQHYWVVPCQDPDARPDSKA
jgi:hypothetical protein